jgi:hypothetical protein
MPDVTANIGSKGTDGTGLNEAIATEMFNSIGKYWMGIVEIQATEPHGPDIKGKRRVSLVISSIEIAERHSPLDSHLRELQNTVQQNRALKTEEGQLAIETGDSTHRKSDDVIAAGQKLVTHEYVDAFEGVCDVCGNEQDDTVHTITDEEPDDPDAEDVEHIEAGDDEPDEDSEEPAGNVTQLGDRKPAFSS